MIERRITKVRFKDGRVEIHQIEQDRDASVERTKEITFHCAEEPADEFVAAFKRLAPHVRTVLELPTDWAEGRLDVTQCSFSESDAGVEGATMGGRVRLDTAPSPFAFNTPHLPFEQYAEGGNQKLMPDKAQADLLMLKHEAKEYLDGKRAQGDLFVDGKSAAAGERPEPTPIDKALDMTTAVVVAIADQAMKKKGGKGEPRTTR